MTSMIDRTPWEEPPDPEWTSFCSLAEFSRIPKEVYGVFTRAAVPSVEGDQLMIGEPPFSVYITRGNAGVWKRKITMRTFVNSDITSFIASLEAFSSYYPYYDDDSDLAVIEQKERAIDCTLRSIDPPAFSAMNNFWPALLEDFVSYADFSGEFLRAEYGVTPD